MTLARVNDKDAENSDSIRKLSKHGQYVFSDLDWSPIDSSGPREILRIVDSKVKDGSIGDEHRPDKFYKRHTYQQMYGMYLLPYAELHHRKSKPMKFFEIGLGCFRGDRGPAATHQFTGLTIWKEIFDLSKDEIWMADFDAECVDNIRAKTDYLNGIRVVTGDQGDETTLKRWADETGGDFDIVIDDGAHLNSRLYASFVHLWPHVKPGGLYFIEDLHVVRNAPGRRFGDDTNGKFIMADVIQDWIDQLMVPRKRSMYDHVLGRKKHRLPSDVKWITCQLEACVIAKYEENDAARVSLEPDVVVLD